MSEEVEPPQPTVGTRWVLPCGHRWTVPWGLPPEVVAADLLRHQSSCDLDSGVPFPAGPWPSRVVRLAPMEVGP